jgi:hypothetical protein
MSDFAPTEDWIGRPFETQKGRQPIDRHDQQIGPDAKSDAPNGGRQTQDQPAKPHNSMFFRPTQFR